MVASMTDTKPAKPMNVALFCAEPPRTEEEMRQWVDEFVAHVTEEVDQGFKDEVDEMLNYKRSKPMMPLAEQKRVTLLGDAIRVCEDKGQDTANLREDLAYLEGKYKGQPREG